MLRLIFSTKNLKKLLDNEIQFWWMSNFFTSNVIHRINIPYSSAYAINHFNTCQRFLREHVETIENFNQSKMILKKDGTVKKKKKPVGVRVYLLNERGISSSMLLQDAEKLAQHQGLKLKRVEDINGVAAYKLVSISDLLETELKTEKGEKKEEKIKKIFIGVDINSHDLQIKINQINKFVNKGLKAFVRLGDRSSDTTKLNAIYSQIEKSLATHTVTKLVSKSGFHIKISPKENPTDDKKN